MLNPYNYHVAVRDDTMFFGREQLIHHLVDGLNASVPLSTAIFGGRRIGKTSLLSKLARVLNSPDAEIRAGRRFVPCMLDMQRGRPLACSDAFFLWVLDEFGATWERQHDLEPGVVVESLQSLYRHRAGRGPVDAFVQAFQTLNKQGERLRMVILLDESEEILSVNWGEDLRPNLRALLSNSPIVEEVALVMAGSTQMYTQVTERDSPLENILDRCTLSGLSYEATLALARTPNQNRLSETLAEEVWRHTGGHPCMAQYLLHKVWEELDGSLEDATPELLQTLAETFDERTRHFSAWAHTIGKNGNATYRFLAEQVEPVSYTTLRQHFSTLSSGHLQGALDALIYHGLVNCEGRGKRCRYQAAGQMYKDWFLAAGEIDESESVETPPEPPQIIVHGDYIVGDGNVIGDGSEAEVKKREP